MELLNNIIYDIKAIKKYGLVTHIKYLFDYKHVIVNLHTHLDYAPVYTEKPHYKIKEVDINNPEVLQKWVDIVNDAFGYEKPYTVKSAKKYLNNHPYKKVENVFFVYDEIKPVGTIFIGTFKKNTKIGSDGRISVLRDYQKRGLGRLLLIFGFQKLREKGIKHVESVFVTKRDYSIRLYLKCGAVPQFKKEYLQLKPTRKSILVTLWARHKVNKMYQEFRDSLEKPYLNTE